MLKNLMKPRPLKAFTYALILFSFSFALNCAAAVKKPLRPYGPPVQLPASAIAPTQQVTPSMQKPDCAELLTWMTSVKPSELDAQNLESRIFDVEQKIRAQTQRQGMVGRRAYAEGNQVFEDLLAMLASGYSANTIVDRMAQYVYPAFDQAVLVMTSAEKIHLALQSKEKPEFVQGLIDQYISKSEKFGQTYSRYSMIMETLVSIASNRGALDVGTVSQKVSPSLNAPATASNTTTNATPNLVETVRYDLTSPQVAALARKVLERIDHENMHRGNAAAVKFASRGLYPSLNLVQTIYRNNLYALLANRQWSLNQQNYSDRPWVWLAQLISDWTVNTGVNLTKGLPQGLRRFTRFLTGLGNADSMMARYLPDLIDVVRISEFSNSKGQIVISNDPYFLSLQIDRLMDNSAASFNDDEIVTLARLLWHTQVWDNILNQVAQKAKASPVWAARLTQLQNAQKQANSMTPIPFAAPRSMFVMFRTALTLIGWPTLIYQLHTHWPALITLFQHLK